MKLKTIKTKEDYEKFKQEIEKSKEDIRLIREIKDKINDLENSLRDLIPKETCRRCKHGDYWDGLQVCRLDKGNGKTYEENRKDEYHVCSKFIKR